MPITVSELNIYPLKSAQGISRDRMTLSDIGPDSDRSYMLVHAEGDKRGKFISQRTKGCHKLALVQPINPFTELTFTAPGMEPLRSREFGNLHFGFDKDVTEPEDVTVWEDSFYANDAGDLAASWFSSYLGFPVRLVSMDIDERRQVDTRYAQEGDRVSLADGFPLLITNENSLSDLSRAFDNASFEMNRFRANIVLSGLDPWEEDRIHLMRIGETVIELCKPCSRCQIPGIDQHNGQADKPSSVLKALAKLRRGNGAEGLSGVFFGQNAIPRQIGEIKLGDKVEVLSTRPMHPTLEGARLKFDPLA